MKFEVIDLKTQKPVVPQNRFFIRADGLIYINRNVGVFMDNSIHLDPLQQIEAERYRIIVKPHE